ncbi:MAG: tyrosine-type recombinase/integrase [Nannocystales bacterium]
MSDRQLQRLPIGEHAVGQVPGLVVRVRAKSVKIFALRYRNDAGKKRILTLGRYPDELSLGDARARASEARLAIREGRDPFAERTARKRAAEENGERTIETAIGWWLDGVERRLSPSTLRTYRTSARKFGDWAKRRVSLASELDRGALANFRAFLTTQPKALPARGKGRGRKRVTEARCSPVGVNRDLRCVKTMLGALRKAGWLPLLDSDAITDNLAALPIPHEAPRYFSKLEIRQLLAACQEHDESIFKQTRFEHARGLPGGTPRHPPIRPFTLFLLLTGCRRGEALSLRWTDVDLDSVDQDGKPLGELRLQASDVKTRTARTVFLDHTPLLRSMLIEMRDNAKGERVFEGLTAGAVESARKRLLREHSAIAFLWKDFRSTAATYLTNASGIFGSATIHQSARQLGHSAAVAERHYLGVLRGIPKTARTLEEAMGVEG